MLVNGAGDVGYGRWAQMGDRDGGCIKWVKLAREAVELGHAGKWLRGRRIRQTITSGL